MSNLHVKEINQSLAGGYTSEAFQKEGRNMTIVAMVSGIAAIELLQFIARRGKFGGFAYYCWVIGVLSVILYLIF